jgi:hypothetical protein
MLLREYADREDMDGNKKSKNAIDQGARHQGNSFFLKKRAAADIAMAE